MQHKRKRRTILTMKPNHHHQESSESDSDNEQYWVFPVGSQVHPQSSGRRTARQTNRSNDLQTAMEWTCRDFRFHDKVWIGSGQFGHVYKVQQQHQSTKQQQDHCVALKQFDKVHFAPDRQRQSRSTRRCKPTLQLLHDEINIHSHLQHDNILSMLGYFHDTSSLYLVLEYTPHGDLKRHLFRNQYTNNGPSTNDTTTRQVVLHMTQALAYLQTLQIAHRDLKPENILVTTVDDPSTATPSTANTNYKFKLADFGWATWWRHNGRRHTTLCGTPEFVPPELLVHESYDPKWVDSWALGLLALEVRYGCTPFGGNATHDIFDKIRQFYYQPSYKDTALWFPRDECDDEDDDDEHQQRANWRDFVTSLLQRDPIERMTAHEALEHDYLKPPQEPLLSVDHAGDHDASTSSQVFKPTQSVQQTLSSPSVVQRCQLFEQTEDRKQQCFESIAVASTWDSTSGSSDGSDSTRNTSFSDSSSNSCSDGDRNTNCSDSE